MNRPSDTPLDPASPHGRDVAERLTAFLAEMRLRVAARQPVTKAPLSKAA